MGGGVASKPLAPSSSNESHLVRRRSPVLTESGRTPVLMMEAILEERSLVERFSFTGREGEDGISRGNRGQPYLIFFDAERGNRGI